MAGVHICRETLGLDLYCSVNFCLFLEEFEAHFPVILTQTFICESKVYSKHYALDRTNNTYIGIDFINLFNYSVFDYERKQVVFYTDQFIIEQSILLEQTKRGIIIQWICSSIIVLLILFIILLLFTYKKIE